MRARFVHLRGHMCARSVSFGNSSCRIYLITVGQIARILDNDVDRLSVPAGWQPACAIVWSDAATPVRLDAYVYIQVLCLDGRKTIFLSRPSHRSPVPSRSLRRPIVCVDLDGHASNRSVSDSPRWAPATTPPPSRTSWAGSSRAKPPPNATLVASNTIHALSRLSPHPRTSLNIFNACAATAPPLPRTGRRRRYQRQPHRSPPRPLTASWPPTAPQPRISQTSYPPSRLTSGDHYCLRSYTTSATPSRLNRPSHHCHDAHGTPTATPPCPFAPPPARPGITPSAPATTGRPPLTAWIKPSAFINGQKHPHLPSLLLLLAAHAWAHGLSPLPRGVSSQLRLLRPSAYYSSTTSSTPSEAADRQHPSANASAGPCVAAGYAPLYPAVALTSSYSSPAPPWRCSSRGIITHFSPELLPSTAPLPPLAQHLARHTPRLLRLLLRLSASVMVERHRPLPPLHLSAASPARHHGSLVSTCSPLPSSSFLSSPSETFRPNLKTCASVVGLHRRRRLPHVAESRFAVFGPPACYGRSPSSPCTSRTPTTAQLYRYRHPNRLCSSPGLVC